MKWVVVGIVVWFLFFSAPPAAPPAPRAFASQPPVYKE